ncbi:MAG: type II toxin-antitoxin system YafQ family toxin [Gallionella sp.]|nr:type II toxin-antitoxin system YafQ family toxin [Gallionella sp.]
MRGVFQQSLFKTDLKRVSRSGRYKLEDVLDVITKLANDEPLVERHRDHALTGEWKDCRDCHIKPDLVLIYQKPNDKILQLVRLGSHSELGL